MRLELARSGWCGTMTEKSLRRIGKKRQPEQCKKSAYMEEEVWETIWLV
jgi:hypothetical protein